MYETVRRSPLLRSVVLACADAFILSLSLFLALWTHHEYSPAIEYGDLLAGLLFYFVPIKLSVFVFFRIYRITWRFVGISDLVNIFAAVLLAELVLTVLSMPSGVLPSLPLTQLSKRIFFVDGIVSFLLIAGLRLSRRLYLELSREMRLRKTGQVTLIVGAGNTGEMLLRDLMRNGFKDFAPVGFLDDNPVKVGSCIHGVKVLGTVNDLSKVAAKHRVQAIIIAIPRLNHKALSRIYDGATNAGVKTIKIIPRIYDLSRPDSRPDIHTRSLESINIEDLLGRQAVSVDYEGIREFVRGKSVLITGAGGSIGSEIAVQVCTFLPERVVLLDIDETELHNLGLKLHRMFPHLMERIVFVTGDIRDKTRLCEVFGCWRPQIVFHAAAYKHVPMMESNPKEAVKVNIFGTFHLATTAREFGVEQFIMISSDKAVRPTSVMGATKRMAEFICSALNEKPSAKIALFPGKNSRISRISSTSTRFVSVRFGNVLGSRGSVLPLFLDQLKYGGPLTITHREMKRYFMTIPEAVSLVLQASILGKGGEVFVLDMGSPAKIVDIAEELIRIHGMEPYKDIDIQVTGLRPGEKLFEEILTPEEGAEASLHEQVFIARNSATYTLEHLREILEEFTAAIRDTGPDSNDWTKLLLKKYVKHYTVDEENMDKTPVNDALAQPIRTGSLSAVRSST